MTNPQHFFLVYSIIGYKNKKNENLQAPFTFITFGPSENINRKAYLDLAVYAQKHAITFLGEDQVSEITSVEVHAISHLGFMTKEEFEITGDEPSESAVNTEPEK